MAKKKKKKLTKAGKIVLDVLIVLCLGVAAFSGYNLYKELNEYNTGIDTYAELTTEATKVHDESDADSSPYDYDSLSEQNPDFLGWIKMNDSKVDYPFVQGGDNAYYLKHLFTGEYNDAGCIFMDVNNASDFSDKNTILYGHNMYYGDGMFTHIELFKTQDWYDSHKEIYIYTKAQNYVMYPVAGILTNGNDDYIRTSFTDDEDFLSYVDRFVSESTFTSDYTIEADDQMILLSTCSYYMSNGRYALIGKLVKVD